MKQLSLLFCLLFLMTTFLQSQTPTHTKKDYAYTISKDNAHWEDCIERQSQELTIEHMRIYPDCHHHRTALDLLEKIKFLTDNMVFIEGGTFQMGSEDKGVEGEKPIHKVTVDDFYMGRFEVTVAEFAAFINATDYKTDTDKDGGSYMWNGDDWEKQIGVNWQYDAAGKLRPSMEYNHPVLDISWYDAVAYCNWLSEKHLFQKVYTINGTKVTANWNANGYRLPTEAEWEFAARSRGSNHKWAGTSSEADLAAYGNYDERSIKDGYAYTAPVGSFRCNDSGLYDMSGNAWEWCWDWYGYDYYKKSIDAINPRGPDSTSLRVLRGGAWYGKPTHLRCTNRYVGSPDGRYLKMGFRLSRTGR